MLKGNYFGGEGETDGPVRALWFTVVHVKSYLAFAYLSV